MLAAWTQRTEASRNPGSTPRASRGAETDHAGALDRLRAERIELRVDEQRPDDDRERHVPRLVGAERDQTDRQKSASHVPPPRERTQGEHGDHGRGGRR